MKFEYVTFFDREKNDGTDFDKISLVISAREFLLADADPVKYDELMSAIVSYVYLNGFKHIFSKTDYKTIATYLTDPDIYVEFIAEYEVNDVSKKWLDINTLRLEKGKYVPDRKIRKSRVLPTGEREFIMSKNRSRKI